MPVRSHRETVEPLLQRLGVTAHAFGVEWTTHPTDDAATAASRLLEQLTVHVHAEAGTADLWLLLTALGGAMPEADDVRDAIHARRTTSAGDFLGFLLDSAYVSATSRGSADAEMDIVSGVVVDVDFSARHDLHTGIQRVVRETVPRWAAVHDLTLVAWTSPGGAYRRLARQEEDRVLRWRQVGGLGRTETSDPEHVAERLVVPRGAVVLLPENPSPDSCPPLVGMSLFSDNQVALIGYDCIPALSPELIHHGLPDRFMRYLEVVKHADRVVAISAGATTEFAGFAAMLGAQGLDGPSVVECSLPVEVPPGQAAVRSGPPLVVSVGSFEPRKNQLALLHAAEHLWRAGLRFELQFIGGGGWATEFDLMMRRLKRDGRPVSRLTAITDDALWATIRAARCTVFISLHEGFGLPVAESLACGVPCLTSNYGSTREIAEGGGAITVDPRDDAAVQDALRRLLTDDDLVESLRGAALARPSRTWDDYAGELWSALVLPQATRPEA